MGPLQGISHAWAFANAVGNSIDQAELGRKILVLVSDADDKEGLLGVTQGFVVDIFEVLRHSDFLVVLQECLLDRVGFEVNV